MRSGGCIFLTIAALAAGPVVPGLRAHCTRALPKVEMSFPSEGVAVQNACYEGYGECYLDTFYVDTLRARVAEAYRSNRYAAFLYVDSVHNYLTFDTVWYRGEINYIDTFQTERVHMSVAENLKDTLPVRNLTFVNRWIAFKDNPYATTYLPLIDTPLVAFFSVYDNIWDLGIYPMDGCFFEPTAYFIYGGAIHRKGMDPDRMPGVTLAMEDFFQTIGRDPVDVPAVRPKAASLPPSSRPRRSVPGRGGPCVDALGRRMEGGSRPSWYPAWGLPRRGAQAPPAH